MRIIRKINFLTLGKYKRRGQPVLGRILDFKNGNGIQLAKFIKKSKG
jgi:hypothetical protein